MIHTGMMTSAQHIATGRAYAAQYANARDGRKFEPSPTKPGGNRERRRTTAALKRRARK